MSRAKREGARGETLDFVQQMLGQLRDMATAEGCEMLAYLIEMARIEAHDAARAVRPSRPRSGAGDRS
ncbi:MAG: hypothetical protein Q8Q62_06260 [Mesorhizobium sp.]|nr:hypothetical protein [Mesorhizobium sp.]